MLNAHQLNVFLIAAETLNFTEAAQRLQMSQPSVSQHIQALEKHFDIQLFSRTSRYLNLTAEGATLIPLARELVRQSTLIEETMESMKGGVYGHLRVGCSTTPGKYILPRLLARFLEVHDRVKITCEILSQSEALQKLCIGEIQFALTSFRQEAGSEVEFHPFMCDKVCLIVPKTHPWADQVLIEPEALCQGHFIHREQTSGTYYAVQSALASRGIAVEKLHTLLILGNSEAIALAVQEGLGVGFISQTVLEKLVPDKVVPVSIQGLEIYQTIFIGHHTQNPSTRAQTVFWEYLCQQAGLMAEMESLQRDHLNRFEFQ